MHMNGPELSHAPWEGSDLMVTRTDMHVTVQDRHVYSWLWRFPRVLNLMVLMQLMNCDNPDSQFEKKTLYICTNVLNSYITCTLLL
jgi:hypothetical protein